MLSFHDRKDIFFPWDELNCIVRPQYLYYESINKGKGIFYLFLTSFYRRYCINGYFQEPNKGLPELTQEVICPYLGSSYDIRKYSNVTSAINDTYTKANDGSLSVFPGNIIKLPYSINYEYRSWPHYFHFLKYSNTRDSLLVLDNLHIKDSFISYRYSPTWIKMSIVNDLMEYYNKYYCQRNIDKTIDLFHGMEGIWLLHLGQKKQISHLNHPEPSIKILDFFIKNRDHIIKERSSFDIARYYEAIDLIIQKKNVEDKQHIVSRYMESSNFNLIFWRILKLIISELNIHIPNQMIEATDKAIRDEKRERYYFFSTLITPLINHERAKVAYDNFSDKHLLTDYYVYKVSEQIIKKTPSYFVV